ncbi:MAG: hypothetical protein AAF611_23225 [Bacteroidota bacterium]
MYNIVKNEGATSNFFYGVVNSAGSAYILQMSDRAAFIAFGDKHLSSEEKNLSLHKIIMKKDLM